MYICRKTNVTQINGGNYKCSCECENVMYGKKIMFRILLHVVVKMENL